MITYDQEINDAFNALLEKLDVKHFDALEHEIEQVKYYIAVRTQMIENLAEDLQRVSGNFQAVLNDVNDDDDYFESESRRERERREKKMREKQIY